MGCEVWGVGCEVWGSHPEGVAGVGRLVGAALEAPHPPTEMWEWECGVVCGVWGGVWGVGRSQPE